MFWKNKKQEEWAMVLNPLKSEVEKAELVEKLIEIFPFSLDEASQLVERTPLVLFDDLPLSTASELKLYFKQLNVDVLITNDKNIKRKCFKAVWPSLPSFDFLKSLHEQELPSEAPVEERKKEEPQPAETEFETPSPEEEALPEAKPKMTDDEPNFDEAIGDLQKALDTIEEPEEIYGKGSTPAKKIKPLKEIKPKDEKPSVQKEKEPLPKEEPARSSGEEVPFQAMPPEGLGEPPVESVITKGPSPDAKPAKEEKPEDQTVDEKIASLYKELEGTTGIKPEGGVKKPVEDETFITPEKTTTADIPATIEEKPELPSADEKSPQEDIKDDVIEEVEEKIADTVPDVEPEESKSSEHKVEAASSKEDVKKSDEKVTEEVKETPKEKPSQDIVITSPKFIGGVKEEKKEKLRKRDELIVPSSATPPADKTLFDDVKPEPKEKKTDEVASPPHDVPPVVEEHDKKEKELISEAFVTQEKVKKAPAEKKPEIAGGTQELQDELKRLSEQNDELAIENQDLLEKNRSLADLEEKAAAYEKELLVLNDTVEALRRENDILKQSTDTNSELQNNLDLLEQKIVDHEVELTECKDKIETLEREKSLLKEKLGAAQQMEQTTKDLEERITLLTTELKEASRLQDEYERLSKISQQLEEDKESIETKYAQLTATHEQRIKELENELERLSQVIEVKESERVEAQDAFDDLNKRCNALNEIVEEYEKRCGEFQDQQQVAAQRIKDLERAMANVDADMSKKDAEIAALKQEQESFNQKRKEIADKIRNLLAINKELMQYKENARDVLEQLHKNKREFDHKLATQEKELQQKSDLLNEKMRQLEDLSQENDRFKVEIGQMRNQIKSFTAEKDRIELMQKRAQLQTSITEKEANLKKILADQEAFQGELQLKRKVLEDLELKRAEIEKSLQDVKRSEKHVLEMLMKKDKPKPKPSRFTTEEPEDGGVE
ncbi:MAG: hypothetical protein JW938_00440 [Candidatus Omnitrophica bacterium]|nr:hypothetical protein [Candidatus Omnitrophota bacterium]